MFQVTATLSHDPADTGSPTRSRAYGPFTTRDEADEFSGRFTAGYHFGWSVTGCAVESLDSDGSDPSALSDDDAEGEA